MQVVAHLSWIPLILYGRVHHFVIVLFIYFLTGCWGMSVTYHRLLSHRSWRTKPIIEGIGSLLGTLGLTGSTLSWVAIHRQHHNHTDEKLDPHSPIQKGFLRSHFLSMYEKPNLVYVRDLASSPFHCFLHKHYFTVQGLYVFALYFIDPFSIIYAYLAPAAVLWNSGSAVNSFCHLWGYKNFTINNSAKNNFIFGIVTFGEGWHNNHHRYPRNPSFRFRWFEFDMGFILISLLKRRS